MKKMLNILILLMLVINLNLIYGMDDQQICSKSKISKVTKEDVKRQYELEAIECFMNGQLNSIDPLVGDTSCQVRALFNAALYNEVLRKKSLGEIIEFTEYQKEFLMMSRLLTKTKISEDCCGIIRKTERNDYKLLGLSKKLATDLIKEFRMTLSEHSIEYIQQIAQNLDHKELIDILHYVLPVSDIFGIFHCACYPTMKLVFLQAYNLDIPIVIKISRYCSDCRAIHQRNFIYKKNENILTQFISCDVHDLDVKKAAIIITGFSSDEFISYGPESDDKFILTTNECEQIETFCRDFATYNIMDLILGNAANHPQFSGLHKEEDIPFHDHEIPNLHDEIERMRMFGKANGCWEHDKSKLFIDHIYADVIENVFNLNEVNNE